MFKSMSMHKMDGKGLKKMVSYSYHSNNNHNSNRKHLNEGMGDGVCVMGDLKFLKTIFVNYNQLFILRDNRNVQNK